MELAACLSSELFLLPDHNVLHSEPPTELTELLRLLRYLRYTQELLKLLVQLIWHQ